MTDTPLDLDATAYRLRELRRDLRARGRVLTSWERDLLNVGDALVAALRKAEAQVAAVLALHAPRPITASRPDWLICTGCSEPDMRVTYPCATVRAAGAS